MQPFIGGWLRDPIVNQEPCMKTVEYWRWRYRNAETGRVCRTVFPCSADEAGRLYPGAERIEGTMILRKVDESQAVSMKGKRTPSSTS